MSPLRGPHLPIFGHEIPIVGDPLNRAIRWAGQLPMSPCIVAPVSTNIERDKTEQLLELPMCPTYTKKGLSSAHKEPVGRRQALCTDKQLEKPICPCFQNACSTRKISDESTGNVAVGLFDLTYRSQMLFRRSGNKMASFAYTAKLREDHRTTTHRPCALTKAKS